MSDVSASPTRRAGEVSSFFRRPTASRATDANKLLQRKIPTGLADGSIVCLSSARPECLERARFVIDDRCRHFLNLLFRYPGSPFRGKVNIPSGLFSNWPFSVGLRDRLGYSRNGAQAGFAGHRRRQAASAAGIMCSECQPTNSRPCM